MGCPIRKFPDQSLFAAPRNLSQRTTSFIASQRQGIRRIPFWHLIVLEIRKRTARSPPLQANFATHETASADEPQSHFLIRKDQFCFKHIREPAVRRGSRLVCFRTTKPAGLRSQGPEPCGPSLEIAPSAVSSPKPDALPLHNVMERETAARRAGHPSARPLGRLPFEDRSTSPSPTALASSRHLQTLFHRKRRASCAACGHLWWSQTGSNRRPHACKARALPTELWPLSF